jgi:hypothetical protein
MRITNVSSEALLVRFPHTPSSEHKIVPDAVPIRLPAPETHRKAYLGCPSLFCVIGNAVIPMIIDTGSSVSFLYSNHVNQGELERHIDGRSGCHPIFHTVTHPTLPALGVIHSIDVLVHGIQTTAQFIVLSSMAVSGILGIDWLKRYHARIDPRKGLITISGETFQLPR